VIELSRAFSTSLKDHTEKKYSMTALKRVAQLLAKLSELYPSVASPLIHTLLLDKLPHKNTAVDSQYLYYRFLLDFCKASQLSEERILEGVVERLCQIDVDIKATKTPRRRCNHFSSLSKIQPMTQYLKELHLKVPNEKEVKMGLLFDMLMTYVKERLSAPLKENEKAADDQFIELLLKVLETKIFPIHKLNFMQYLPIFVMGFGKLNDEPNIQAKCKVFTEKLLSFLIFKAFKPTVNQQLEPLGVRMHAINFLASLLAKENDAIKPQTILKCLQFILKFFETSLETPSLERGLSENFTTEASENEAATNNAHLS